MKTVKKIGVWMDHVHADLMEFSDEPKETVTISCDFEPDRGGHGNHGDKEMKHKKQQATQQFFKKILDEIKSYDEVLLFGPGDAKSQFQHFIREHHHYDKMKLETENSDNLNDKQKHAFVREHFRKFDIRK